MNTVKVRNTVIGEGMPKICVPIVGVTKEAILEEAKAITRLPADVVEWRIDWFENVFDFAALEDVMKDLRQVLGDLPLLMTFRTSKEGGEKAIEDEVYADINIKAAQTGYVDMVDVEIFTGDDIVRRIIEGAHAAGVKVVASNHDFFKTPEKDDIVRPSLQNAGDGCGHSEDCRDAAEQEGRADPLGSHGGDGIDSRRPSDHHHVDGGHRRHQPSVR